jgi:hypothetical protein
MSWQERFASKMNRSSWKIAHNDHHPHIDDENDLLGHLTTHHKGQFIGDEEDHELYHTDPNGYNAFYSEEVIPTPKNDEQTAGHLMKSHNWSLKSLQKFHNHMLEQRPDDSLTEYHQDIHDHYKKVHHILRHKHE